MKHQHMALISIPREATTIPASIESHGISMDAANVDARIPYNYDYRSVLQSSMDITPMLLRPLNSNRYSDFF